MFLKKRLTMFLLSACMLLLEFSGAYAKDTVTLENGAVKGLPEDLTIVDSDGRHVDENGEYFFLIEDMKPGIDYKKDIQLMNLRQDKSYHIYLKVEGVSNEGNIDLLNNCECLFTMDGRELYSGLVNGEGTQDLSNEPMDLGIYKPGDTKTLTTTVNWNGAMPDIFVDNGSRTVDAEGEHITTEKSGDGTAYGETKFRWIFYAAVDEEYSSPKTGILFNNRMYIIFSCVMMALILLMLSLIILKKKKQKNRSCSSEE